MSEELQEAPTPVVLSGKDKNLAAFNNPVDAERNFTFGGREFPVLYLEYDDYIEFISLLQPLFDSIAGTAFAKKGVSLPGITLPASESFSLQMLLKYCAKDLPRLVAIVCNQAAKRADKKEDLVTPEWVKKHARSPFELVHIVSLQIAQNKFITEISDFFVQCLPLFQKVTNLLPK